MAGYGGPRLENYHTVSNLMKVRFYITNVDSGSSILKPSFNEKSAIGQIRIIFCLIKGSNSLII